MWIKSCNLRIDEMPIPQIGCKVIHFFSFNSYFLVKICVSVPFLCE